MKIFNKLFLLVIVTVLFAGAAPFGQAVFAQGGGLKLTTPFPRIESSTPRDGFKFTVALEYQGSQPEIFNLSAAGPVGWNTYITSWDEKINVSAITVDPAKPYENEVKVIAYPPQSVTSETGEYQVRLTAGSGDVLAEIVLTAVVKPTYSLVITPDEYDNKVYIGRDNTLDILLANKGSGTLTNIRLSADVSTDWVMDFKPSLIDALAPGSTAEIEVNIRPPESAGRYYYQINVTAEADEAEVMTGLGMQLVKQNGSWLWIGGAIVFVLIVGFIIVFLRLNRAK